MTYQFERDPINDCYNFNTRKECPMFEPAFDGKVGYCKLSKRWIYYHYEEPLEGIPEWCELVRVK